MPFRRLIVVDILEKWFCGRVARQSSAKASTAVRICSEPPSTTLSVLGRDFFYKL